MTTPTSGDIIIWIICAIAAIVLISKGWPLIKRMVATGDAISTLPELTEQVGLLTTAFDDFTKEMRGVADRVKSVEEHVANSHTINLRDDLDQKHDESMSAIADTRSDVADIKARQNADALVLAGIVERQNDGEKAIVRVYERIERHHPPTP